MSSKKKTSKTPSVVKKIETLDVLSSALDKVVAETKVNKGQVPDVPKKIDILRTKVSSWEELDKQVGDLKACLRTLTGDKGRRIDLPSCLKTDVVKDHVVAFLAAEIKIVRLKRNKTITK